MSTNEKQKPPLSEKIAGLAGLIFIIWMAFSLQSCSDKKDAPVSAEAKKVNSEQVAALENAQKFVPPTPSHYYSYEEDGEYGYEPAISEDEQKQGIATKSLLMTRYLGEKNGLHSIQMSDGAYKAIYSCKTPCEFIKVKKYFSGSLINTETVKNAPNSVISSIMEDAQNGFLKIYAAQNKADQSKQ